MSAFIQLGPIRKKNMIVFFRKIMQKTSLVFKGTIKSSVCLCFIHGSTSFTSSIALFLIPCNFLYTSDALCITIISLPLCFSFSPSLSLFPYFIHKLFHSGCLSFLLWSFCCTITTAFLSLDQFSFFLVFFFPFSCYFELECKHVTTFICWREDVEQKVV